MSLSRQINMLPFYFLLLSPVSASTSNDAFERRMQAMIIAPECQESLDLGDNPCVDGCGHAPVPNPFNPNAVEAAQQQRPAPCRSYACYCADSGCGLSWDTGCIKFYMQCQTDTQICGSLADAPLSVQNFEIGESCYVDPRAANTPFCFPQPPATPPPGDDDDDDDDGKGGIIIGKKGKGGKGGKKGGDDYGYGGKKAGGKGKGGDDGKKGGGYTGGKKGGGYSGKKGGGKGKGGDGGKKAGYDGGKKAGYDGGKKAGRVGKKGHYGDDDDDVHTTKPVPAPSNSTKPVPAPMKSEIARSSFYSLP